MADRGCNLECVKHGRGGDNAIEFVGPVKIVLVDQPKSAYVRKTCYAALIVLAQMMMATATILVMFYSLSYKKSCCFKALHVFLCTVGLQIIMLSGVLSLNNLSGSSAPMKISDCKFEHVFLECFGLASAIAGVISTFFSGYSSILTAHSCSGIAASVLAVFCAISGLFINDFRGETKFSEEYSSFRRFVYYVHQLLGTAEAILSLNHANGWSAPMKLKHRRFAHAFLQICAMICAFTGTLLISISKGFLENVHGTTGIIAAILSCNLLAGSIGIIPWLSEIAAYKFWYAHFYPIYN
ncbi:unnamed protein product [Euphydryas editha]|uniref:Cytochrome b561 domain-containing protein n=1 Tax=Euphydryas editha TaxID=104508 RepID=A0AAU9TRR2_EUPED|nr:unnamed protein product [Euphydryas editha]